MQDEVFCRDKAANTRQEGQDPRAHAKAFVAGRMNTRHAAGHAANRFRWHRTKPSLAGGTTNVNRLDRN
jgi:hypothetical protein